ncbi:hypothetical protein CLU79DRAFT_747427 [Phycomyces nitens]|nr:hypothetical protein CLU79DRAFT_747427 [Phycomyces nitens]
MSNLQDSIQHKPLYVFSLPEELLSALVPVDKETEEEVQIEWKQQALVTSQALQRLEINEDQDTLTCRTCDITFTPTEREEHRKHYNTDWHRYNIKRRLVLDTTPVSFIEFEKLLADLSDSISGTDSEDTDEESDTEVSHDRVNALVGKQKSVLPDYETTKGPNEEGSLLQKRYSAMVWFNAKPLLPGSIHLGVYRTLFSKAADVAAIQALQSKKYEGRPRFWTILMLGGGHFAGCVVDVNQSKGISEPSVDKQVKLITHKSFHRYTTRRKQGGAQSSNDNAKGKANSAGAQIRRYNEQLLQKEVRELLSQWKSHIDRSELVLVHAPSNNRKIVYGYENAVLTKENPKVKSIPFVTKRPTLSELKRVFLEVSTLKVVEMDEEAILAHKNKAIEKEEKARQLLEKSKQQKPANLATKQKVETSPELEKLVGLVRQGKTSVIFSYLSKHKDIQVSSILPSYITAEDSGRFPTLLHLASHYGHRSLVEALLMEAHADPTVKSEGGKTAYEVAKDKSIRNVFRRCMHEMPEKWAWLEEARVPSPLTPEAEQEQLEKERVKKEKEEAKARLVEEERLQREAEEEAKEQQLKAAEEVRKRGKANVLVAKALIGSQGNMANMSPEARARLEREKRAKAAEERMRRMAGN